MPDKPKPGRDAFTFSLNGLRVMAPFTFGSAIAHDRINNAIAEKLREHRKDEPEQPREVGIIWGRFWLRARRSAA